MSYITLIIPHSIYSEADITRLTARLPYIIVLIAPLVEPEEDRSIAVEPIRLK
jgi:hypothetical protein